MADSPEQQNAISLPEKELSQLKAEHAALRRSEEHFRQIVQHVGEGMVVVQDGRFVFANPRAEEITGYTLTELRSEAFDRIIHPDDRAAVRERHEKRLGRESVEPSYEFRIINRAGAVRWLEIGGSLISWDGAPATLTFFSDVTQRKLLEAQLRQSLSERETTLQHSIVGIAFLTPNGRMRWANDALARIFRARLADNENATLEPYYTSRQQYLAVGQEVAKAVRDGQLYETELQMRRGDGQPFWAYLSGKAIDSQDLSQGTVWVVMDISQRRELEVRLEKKSIEQEAILQTSQIGIAHTIDRVHQWVNAEFCELVGFTAEELIGQNSRLHFPDEASYRNLGDAAYPLLAKGGVYAGEHQMMRKNGEVFWVQMRGKNVDPHDPDCGAIWTIADITERRNLERELRQRTTEQDAILQTCQIGISFTRNRMIQWVNRSFVNMMGFDFEDLLGQRSRLHFPNEDSFERFGQQAYPCLAQGGVFTCEWEMMKKSGDSIWLDMRAKNIDAHDPTRGTIWTVMDITPRKQMEEQLRATSSEREAILQSALVGITFSVDRRHQWVNRTFARMMGFSPEELIGLPSRVHYPDEESWRRLGETAYPILQSGQTFESECLMARRDGTTIWVQLYGSCVEQGKPEKGTIWTFLDISQRKQAEEDTRRALVKQRELNDLKSRFVSMTSHEFRTPLATILSSAELLRYYSDRLPADERVSILDSIEVSVRRMTQMLDNILLIGRADAEMLEFRPGKIDLTALCRECADAAAHSASGEQRPSLLLDIAPDIRSAILDENLLRHVLGNLLSNAFKYSPAGGEIRFAVRRDDGNFEFLVSDQGIGIPENELPRLFESFHRAENVGNIQGTGLGLAIVKKSLKLQGGSIEVSSRQGQGTRFVVRIPEAESSHG